MYKTKLIKVIALFEYLIQIEDSSTYRQILTAYNQLLLNINNKEKVDFIKADFKPLQNVYKMYYESPSADKVLGKYILNLMQELYEIELQIFKKKP
tara:strand:+ start:799 stop:1086 length:288 start_codon:yes stop_codon:yes gene_type:complete